VITHRSQTKVCATAITLAAHSAAVVKSCEIYGLKFK
jgi:hypothetical protein